jgi:hypothetical protein
MIRYSPGYSFVFINDTCCLFFFLPSIITNTMTKRKKKSKLIQSILKQDIEYSGFFFVLILPTMTRSTNQLVSVQLRFRLVKLYVHNINNRRRND